MQILKCNSQFVNNNEHTNKKKAERVIELRKFSEGSPDLKQNGEGQSLNLASHLQDLPWAVFALLFTALNFKAPAGC